MDFEENSVLWVPMRPFCNGTAQIVHILTPQNEGNVWFVGVSAQVAVRFRQSLRHLRVRECR